MANDFEPCPLCGKADFRIEVRERDICADPCWITFTGTLKCRTCGLELTMYHGRIRTDDAQQLANEELARQLKGRWNTRAAVTDEQFAIAVNNGKAWQRVRTCHNIYDGREFRCSECGMQWHLLDRADFGEEWAHVRNPAYCPSCGAKVVE